MKVRSPFGKHNLGSAVGLRLKVFSPLGGHMHRVTLEQPRRLGMEYPEAAAEVEVEAGLVEVWCRGGSRDETQ